MNTKQIHVLVIGAHPDDCDIKAGGIAALYTQKGHVVKFVSVTNGDAGHHEMGGGPLTQRRNAEAQAAAEIIGIEYELLDIHDGELMPTLENRFQIIRTIRDFRPDLIMTHRPNDYHPDHRYTSMLVQDAAYMVTVPNICALTPHLERNPVIVYLSDGFKKPNPFKPELWQLVLMLWSKRKLICSIAMYRSFIKSSATKPRLSRLTITHKFMEHVHP